MGSPSKYYSPIPDDRLDVLVAAELNRMPYKLHPKRINRGYYKFRYIEFEVAEVNGKLMVKAKSWNNEKFGSFGKFLIYLKL
jgi:hypothetical protein